MPQSHTSGDTTVSISYNIVNTRVTRLERREISVELTSRKEGPIHTQDESLIEKPMIIPIVLYVWLYSMSITLKPL